MTVAIRKWGRGYSVALADGDESGPIFLQNAPCVVTAIPGGGGEMLVEATWSNPFDVQDGGGTWFPWDQGTAGVVTTASNQALDRATAVRFTATGAAGVGEVAR